jgi:hypothetical protein
LFHRVFSIAVGASHKVPGIVWLLVANLGRTGGRWRGKHGCCLTTGNPTSVARRCVPLWLHHGHRPTALKQMIISFLLQYLYYLKRLVAGFSQRSPGFNAKALHLGVVDKLAWQVFLPVFPVYRINHSFHQCYSNSNKSVYL